MLVIWISVFDVMWTAHVYSVLESKRCLALNPDIVDNTNKLSTLTTWKTTA